MIFFDVTKTGAAGHRSGLTRVSSRLRQELGADATAVTWRKGALTDERGAQVLPGPTDWFFTSELFSADERPGFADFLASPPCRLGAIYHDAIPLKFPHITWPQSVARHPAYLKLLARFHRVWAVSRASREELLGFWQWQGLEAWPEVDVIALGADADGQPRAAMVRNGRLDTPRPRLLCVGIVEPRKNQSFLLEACDDLWRDRLAFELHVIGRVNPHFGAPIVRRLKMLQREHGNRLQFHEAAADERVTTLYQGAVATVFPTLAEGCGLPLLESLWRGVPCVCSDLPVLRENADEGGCVPIPLNDMAAWKATLRRLLTDAPWQTQLTREACTRPLPTWAAAAEMLRTSLTGPATPKSTAHR